MHDANIRVAIAGAGGRMGRQLIQAALALEGVQLGAALEREGSSLLGSDAGELAGAGKTGVTVQSSLDAVKDDFDVFIDFTRPEGTLNHLAFCRQHGKGMVIGTTGFDEAGKQAIRDAAADIAIVFAANFSVGVNVMLKLLEKAAKVMGDYTDIEIIEAHHRHKVDAPSGTALAMGEAIAHALDKDLKDCAVYSREEYNATMVSLCAEVASAYFNLREAQQELSVLQRNALSQKAVVDITEVRYNTGLASKLDVAQAKSVYYSTLASIPATESGIIQYMNALAVLLGLYPQDVTAALETGKPLPDYIEPVGVGLPGQLLLRRPDVRVAERQVNAQAALLGASKTDWLPSFFLNGSFGYASHDMKDFTRRSSMTWSIAPSMSWTIFNGGQRANNVRLQRAQLDETINQFNTTVLTAVQEVDNAMSSYKNSIKQIVACREMLNQGKEAFKLSLDLYKQGLSPFQNVLDAQRSLLSYENSLVQAQGYSLLCLIQMYQALGGGW